MARGGTSKKATPKTSENPSSRLKTSDEWNKDFIDLCVEEFSLYGYLGTSLKQHSWDRVIEQMGKKYNAQYTQRQMKQKWDYLRGKYQAWTVLEKRTGNFYNPETSTFDFPDHTWDDIIKSHPLTSQFRHSPLEHKDLLRTLFLSTLAGGDSVFCPKHSIPEKNPRSNSTLEMDDTEGFVNHNTYDSQDGYVGIRLVGTSKYKPSC
ncbi:hypothetical protein ACHQM5_001752 [Ranunculus cassubicifolius]